MIIDPSSHSFPPAKGFIVVEGVNGAGKSTLIKELGTYIESRGRATITTREPGGTKLGTSIRSLLLERSETYSSMTEVFLFAADRAEHVAQVIKPGLKSGKVLISDRYYYSTIAFQGYGRGLDLDTLEQINLIAIDRLLPDLVILLDLDPELGLRRNRDRDNKSDASGDAFEREELDFHQRLRLGFLTMAQEKSVPFVVIDTALTKDEVLARAKKAVDRLFGFT